MKTSISLLYGVAGNFLTTNVRHEYPIPREEDYIPVLPAPEEEQPAIPPLPAALVTKLREFAFERNNKQIAQLVENGQKIFPIMWERCSPASQSKIREDPNFEDAALALDPVRLWGFIRRTHLTHIFGVGDPMTEVNIQEQLARFASLKQGDREHVAPFKIRFDNQVKANLGAGVQGDREHVAPFKIRFDNQVKANLGAGVPDVSDSTRALEFFFKLDDKRYREMLQYYRNKALDNDANAYPHSVRLGNR
jgi:hypothetical protein